MSKKKNEAEKLTVSKIHEILKSKGFIRNMFWDALSGMKEKPTFKQIRETIKEVVNDKLDYLETMSVNTTDRELEKNIVNEICTLAVTVDTMYSRLLFSKLEKEFKNQILNAIKELRNEGEIPDDVWDDLEIEDTTTDEIAKETNSSSKPKMETPVKFTPVPVKKEKQDITCNGDEKLNHQKKNKTKINDENKKKEVSEKEIETRNLAAAKLTSPSVSKSIPKKNLFGKKKTEEEDVEIDVVNDNPDSDTDSVISVGNESLASVSSVHTSDLSSFDDEISLSSGDESAKKKISLKELVSQRASGKLNGMSLKASKDSGETTGNVDKSCTNELLTPSKRIRKPNLKYSSDNILCPPVKVKDRKSDVSKKSEDESFKETSSPKRKRTVDAETGTPSKVQKVNNIKENNSSAEKMLSKRKKSSELYKPVAPVRPLTSRRTAPITLYSTTP